MFVSVVCICHGGKATHSGAHADLVKLKIEEKSFDLQSWREETSSASEGMSAQREARGK